MFQEFHFHAHHSGTPVERALVMVGHEERLRQHDHMPVRLVEHERARRARPRASGYELLVALRLREEGRLRQRAKGIVKKSRHDPWASPVRGTF